MPVYKSKLKSIANSSGVDVSTYYADNSPYTGYVILSKSLPLDASYGLFNDKNITKEYLSRGDTNSLLNSNYAVDLSTIYKTSIGQAGDRASVDHLACAALGKNIGSDNNYFYYYMDIDDNDNISEAGFPFNDNDGGNSIITPFSDSKYSNTLYANFAVVGMSKAATPYINAGLFLEDCNRETLSDVKDLNYNGKNFGGDAGVYEFPGSSALSTMFAEILWKGATNAWDSSVSQSSPITPVLNNDASTYNILDNTIDKIVKEIFNTLKPTASENSSNTRNVYLGNMANTIKNLAITNGDVDEFYGMWLRDSYIPKSSPSDTSSYYAKLDSNDVNYKPGSIYTYKIVFLTYNKTYSHTTYFAVYDKLYAANHSITCGQSEFGRYLSEYYRDFNERIVLDHNTNNNSVNTYKVDPTSNILNPDTNTKYFVVARPTGPFLKLDLGIPKSAVEKINGRHTSYLTRYEAIGLKSEKFYSVDFGASSTTMAHPLMTNDYRLDSSLVSVIGNNFSTSSKITFNNTKAEKNGKVYVSSITLHFRGNTTNFNNNIKISSIDNTIEKVFALNDTEYVYSAEDASITSYKIPLQSFESVAYIGLDTSSNNAPTKLGMTCNICGSQQMVRYNCGYKCRSYIEHLIDASAGVDSQWTLLKLSGVFKIQMSGRNTYSTSINNNTDIILEAVDVEINDESSIEVGIKYIGHENTTINCNTSTSYPHIVNLYNGKSQVVMKEDSDYTSYNAKCVFFNSLCGAKRMNNNIYYNDASILFNDWSSDANNKKISVYANSSNKPVIAVGGYGNALDPSIYAGAAYSNAIVSNAHFDACDDPIVTNTNRNDPLQTGPNTYKIITGDTSINDLNIAFSTSNTLRFSIPKPGVKLLLDYKSVEFNGSSAWTFTRSMPLNAASAANPHILIYKIEAWVETEDEHGNLVIDESASAAISISSMSGNNKHKVFSGRTHYTVEDGSIYGVDYAIQNKEVLNNLYLKYNDNETNIYNAVSTSLPIKLLEPALLPLGEKNENIKISDFYGGNALKYTVVSSTYINDDKENIRRMYNAIKSGITNDIQVCLCSCAGSEQDKDDGVSMTADGKKVIYFGIGFYNNSDLIMPITASFGIDLTFIDESTGESVTYPNRISLNEFFPKDSILYMAGRNYKNSMNSTENTKIRFVKTSDLSNDSGLQKYNREGTLKNNDIQIGEIVNIGGGIQEDNAYHNEGEIHASSIETSGNKVISLYGIFNIYSGEVNYISTGSIDITNAGLPDVLYSSIIEADPKTGAYSNYVKFMNEIAGKCLTESQHICKFIHCTDINNVPYII